MLTEWWRAGDKNEFSLDKKLDHVGCRPLKRNFLAFKTNKDDFNS